MDAAQAVELIRLKEGAGTAAETWYDLGCGTGTFTVALAKLLPSGSTIYAVDRNRGALKRIPDAYGEVMIRKVAANFLNESFEWRTLNGLLMANSLHFVKQQSEFVAKVARAARQFLVVEYERSAASPWQPYPVPFNALRLLLLQAGYANVVRLAERASRFGGKMYSAMAER